MRRYIHSRSFGLLVLIVVLTFLAVKWWHGLPVPPEPPPPPDDVNRLATRWVAWLAPKVIWVLLSVFLIIWGILNWQRQIGESAAARWNRRFMLTLWLFCLTLATGQSALQEWLTIGYSITITLIMASAFGFGAAVGITYAFPLWKCRGDRCVRHAVPAVDGTVLPHPPEPYRGYERRSGRERRRDWRPTKPTLN